MKPTLSHSLEEVRARVSASEERLCALPCQRLETPHGVLYCRPDLPTVYDVNVVRQPQLTVAGIDAELAVLWHAATASRLRHLFFAGDDLPRGQGLADALRARGFVSETLLCMTLAELPPAQPAQTSAYAVRAPSDAATVRALYDSVHHEERWYTPALARDVTTALFERQRTGALRLLGAYAQHAGGDMLLGALGLSHDDQRTYSLVAVASSPLHRNRGVAKTLVRHAVRLALDEGAELIYLLTRQVDWTQRLYRKLGFVDAFRFDSLSSER